MGEQTCTCRCGTIFRSEATLVYGQRPYPETDPCPGCGRTDDCYRLETDPEVMEL